MAGDDQDLRAENIALTRRFVEAINGWDFDTLREILVDDYVFTIPFVPEGFPARIDGRDTWISFVEEWSTQLEGSENLHDLTLDTLGSDPNALVLFYKSDMAMKSGLSYRNRYVGYVTIRDGKIARFDEYLDSILLLIAAGGTVTAPGAT